MKIYFRLMRTGLVMILLMMGMSAGFAASDAESTEWIRDYVKANYYLEVQESQLELGSRKGMLEALDPYSAYYTKSEMDELMQSLSNTFEGVGMVLEQSGSFVKVVKVLSDSPASKAGIMADDLVVTVDGESIRGMALEVVVAKIKGPAGTQVKLGIERTGRSGELFFTLVRQKIVIQSVSYKVLESNIGYLKLEDFSETADERVREIVSNFKVWGIKSLVLDLRGNPGGYLDSAVDIADSLLPAGAEIVTVDYRREANVTEVAVRSGFEGKIAVLVDGNSASASEIVVGALKGRSNVRVFGVTTFGKGLVQEIVRFQEGDGLKLTIAEYYGPNGLKIQAKGVVPDVEVKTVKPDLTPFSNLIQFIYTRPLKIGSSGLDVYALQQRLQILGYTLKPSGTYDLATQNELKAYESLKKLNSDGVLDEIVKKSIDRAIFERYNQVRADQPLQKGLEWLKLQ